MKICILTKNLNTHTGSGELVDNLVKGIKKLRPETTFSILSTDDVLKLDYLSLIKNWFRICQEIRKSDIVQAVDTYPYGVIAALANLFINRPLIIIAVGTGSLQLFDYSSWKAKLFRWAYSRADHIVAISGYVASEIKSHIKKVNISTVNPGIDFEFWSNMQPGTLDSKLNELQPYILSVGELKSRKGYHMMLPIIANLFKINPVIKYVIVANIEINIAYRDKIYKQIKELNIEDRVVILSRLSRDDLRSVFQQAYLYFTLPQNVSGDVEGFGMSILQAAAAGTPAVVGIGSGADDAISDSQSGFLVDGNSEKEVVDKVVSIIDDDVLRQKLSIGAKVWAKDNGWVIKIKQYLELYKKFKIE